VPEPIAEAPIADDAQRREGVVMKLNQTRCHVCDKEMSLCTVEFMEGEAHDVRVQIEGMPLMQCTEGHKRFVVPDFAIRLMEALVEDDRLVPIAPAPQRGLLRKRYYCPACGQDLEGSADRRVRGTRRLELNGLEAFGVRVELPKFHCASCRREYAPPGEVVTGDLMKASARAFRAAAVSAT
jgi:hypothetical protein